MDTMHSMSRATAAGGSPAGEDSQERVRAMADAIYRTESRRVFATLVRLLGDFDLAEEALHDAFRAALEQWPRDGLPANPRAWLVSPASTRGSIRWKRKAWPSASMRSPTNLRNGTAKASRTTGCGSSSPAAITLSRLMRRWRSPCARSAARRPRRADRGS